MQRVNRRQQCRHRGLRAIHLVCEQADNKADAVLLDSYRYGNNAGRHGFCRIENDRANYHSAAKRSTGCKNYNP